MSSLKYCLCHILLLFFSSKFTEAKGSSARAEQTPNIYNMTKLLSTTAGFYQQKYTLHIKHGMNKKNGKFQDLETTKTKDHLFNVSLRHTIMVHNIELLYVYWPLRIALVKYWCLLLHSICLQLYGNAHCAK